MEQKKVYVLDNLVTESKEVFTNRDRALFKLWTVYMDTRTGDEAESVEEAWELCIDHGIIPEIGIVDEAILY